MFNSSFNVYKIEWLDLVFSGRNKSYGAYALRAQSASILTKSLLISGTAFILFFISPLIYQKLNPVEVEPTGKIVNLESPVYDIPKEKIPEKIEAPKKSDPVKVKTVNMAAKIVVVNKEITMPPPTMAEIKDAVISTKTESGAIKPDLVIADLGAKGNGTGTNDAANNGAPDANAINNVNEVDVYPEFEGGMKAWAKYLQRNLKYPYMAQENGVEGRVFISFVVETNGTLSQVTLVKGIGAGCDEEALRVIKKSPAWKPGSSHGRDVRVRYNIPINFTISN